MVYSQAQIDAYLIKIKYKEKIELDGETLKKLQIAHLKNIPYENLNILNHVPISLEPEALFNKMILKPRGGYCFELNGLYSNLLKSLGFEVINLAGRFINDSDAFQMRRHRVLKVITSHGTYICDVGVRNESSRAALKLIDGLIQSDGISEYKFESHDFYGHILWQKEKYKEWKILYAFTDEPQLDIDYVMPSFFCEKHPDSPFISFKKISIFTDKANITLVDNILKFYQDSKVIKEVTFKKLEEVNYALENYFGIKITP